MAIFDDPNRELNRIQEQLLEDEEDFEEEYGEEEDSFEEYGYDEEDYEEEYEEEYEDDYQAEPDTQPRPRSNRGLIFLILAEILGIFLIAAYWLRVIH